MTKEVRDPNLINEADSCAEEVERLDRELAEALALLRECEGRMVLLSLAAGEGIQGPLELDKVRAFLARHGGQG